MRREMRPLNIGLESESLPRSSHLGEGDRLMFALSLEKEHTTH